MIAQALDLLDGFLRHIVLKITAARDHVAAEDELLPHHDAQLIADIVKIVRFVIAAAPLADHVHMRVARRFQNLAVAFRCDPVRGSYRTELRPRPWQK